MFIKSAMNNVPTIQGTTIQLRRIKHQSSRINLEDFVIKKAQICAPHDIFITIVYTHIHLYYVQTISKWTYTLRYCL